MLTDVPNQVGQVHRQLHWVAHDEGREHGRHAAAQPVVHLHVFPEPDLVEVVGLLEDVAGVPDEERGGEVRCADPQSLGHRRVELPAAGFGGDLSSSVKGLLDEEGVTGVWATDGAFLAQLQPSGLLFSLF